VLKSRPAIACVVMRGLWIVLIGFVACDPMVHGQNGTPAALPAAPEAPSAQVRTSAPMRTPAPKARNSWQWNQSPLDPIQPNLAFGVGSRVASSSFGANYARGFSAGQKDMDGFNPLGGPRTAGWPGGVFMQDFSNLFETTPASSPSLYLLMRGNLTAPLNTSGGKSRFTFQEALRPGTDLNHPPAPGLYTTTGLGNGVFLSAGTNLGRSNAGAPAAGANAAAGKHSGTSLGVKLSF